MKPLFKQEDIGKKVVVELDAKKSGIAAALGAKILRLQGTIREVGKDYLLVQKDLFVTQNPVFDLLQQRDKNTTHISYKDVKKYSFLDSN